MFQTIYYSGDKQRDYDLLIRQLQALSDGEQDEIAILSNTSALLNQFLDNTNWVGFYIWKEEENELVLGPFQGLPACIRIGYGKGVCGTAIAKKKTQLLADVHQFPGHIACDGDTNSEIVVPIILDDKIFGVLDIDSPIHDRFDETDRIYLEKFVQTLQYYLKMSETTY
ncbi:GAF domain-containing protein [Virgibacillus sp.]|uniref:GAF domain-containing protein n=1 Tax=Virgibacillus sp. TaxID=1872700 RepID=UPI0017A04059|nr:GAF domain-containing protein [Virgibacillus sp.]NWO13062.1 GAF domain-containing protein [Virgibacillus sp.]